MIISVGVDNKNQAIVKLLKEWPKRFTALRLYTTYKAADLFKTEVLSRIPNRKDLDAYRRSIRMSRVGGGEAELGMYSVYASAVSRGVKKIDTSKTIILVQPKGSKSKKSAAFILQQYGPWTPDTIPYMPKTTEAKVIYKKVALSKVVEVTKARKRDQKQWSKDLANIGIRTNTKKDMVIGKAKDVPDVALQALSLEFGLSGQKPVPHWRNAQKALIPFGVTKMIAKDKLMGKAVGDPQFSLWTRWPPKTPQILSAIEAKKFVGFQDKVRIRVRA